MTAAKRDLATVTEPDVDADQAFVTFGAVLVLHDRLGCQSLHVHRPFELLVALETPFRVSVRDGAVDRGALVVMPLERHAILGCEGKLARLYVDPGPYRLPAPDASRPDVPDDAADEVRSALQRFHASARRLDDARSIIKRWKDLWLGRFSGASVIDPRIRETLTYLDGQAIPDASRSDLAKRCGLSPSRFAALFAQDVRMPLRRYVLWRRVLVAARLIREGDTITRAAVRSGFSDAAHLSRCYREFFGTSPSHLSRIGVPQPISGRNLRFDER